MAGGGDIRVKVGIDGEADFKKQISDCNTSLKTMSTEMAKVTSAFIGNENSSKALKAANKALSDQFDALNKKADIQRARLQELDKAGVDPTDAAYQRLVQELNKTETEMNKTSAQIDQNTEKLKHHGQTAEEAHKKHAEAAKKAAEAVAALSAAVVGVVAGIGKMTLDAAKAADELGTLAVKTGISTDELQKYQYAAESIDVSVDTIAGSMSKLTKNMNSAANGSKSAQEAFAKLGVEVTNSDGSFRDRNEVFKETIAALGEIPDEVERDAAAMAIFGKSAQELNPLIMGGAEALDELGKHAEEAGLIMSGDDISALTTLNNQLDILKQTASMAGNQMLAQFAGPMTEGMNLLTGAVEKLLGAYKSGGLDALGKELGSVATELLGELNKALPSIVSFGSQVILSLVSGLVSMLPEVVSSALTIITTLASSIAEALPELIPSAVEAILTIVNTLTDPANISNLVDSAIAIIMALANGLIAALPQLIAQAPVIIANLVSAIISNASKLLSASYEVIKTLVMGIAQNLVQLGEAAGEIIGRLVRGILDLASTLWDTGKQIVMGIYEGIKNTGDWLWNQVKGFFSGLLDKIKEFLGIHSPSTVFADMIGKNMALGIGVGFDKAMEGVERDMMSAIPTPQIGVSAAGMVPDSGTFGGVEGGVMEIVVPVELDGVECGRGLYRYIIGEGARIGPAMVT